MVNSEEFAQRLQEILSYYGLSATAFSDRIDFNRSTISHLLSGRNKPSLEFVLKVLEAFPEVELYWLLNGKGSFPSHEAPIKSVPTPRSVSGGGEPEPTGITQERPPQPQKGLNRDISGQEIEQIVIFFKDGSFRAYR